MATLQPFSATRTRGADSATQANAAVHADDVLHTNLYVERYRQTFEKRRESDLCEIPREIELQYLVPLEIGEQLRRGRTPVQLTTHYFDNSEGIVRDIIKTLGLSRVFRDIQSLTSARLRESVVSSGASEYLLEFKGKKQQGARGRLERPELSVGISEDVFQELLPDAVAGATVKLRYGVPGFVFSATGERKAVVLQLDQLIRAGKPLSWLDATHYRADIEIPREQLADQIRTGNTTFSEILRECVEISRLPKEVAKDFSYKAIARHGVTEQARRASERLLSAADQL